MFSCRAAATFVCSVFQQLIHLSELHWQSGTFCTVCRWAVGLFVIRPLWLLKSVFFFMFLFWFEIRLDPTVSLSSQNYLSVSLESEKKWMCCVTVSHTSRGESLQLVNVFVNTWEEWGVLLHIFLKTTFTATRRLCFLLFFCLFFSLFV